MTPPVDAVRTAYRDGYAAGENGPPFPGNPYAVEPLAPWKLARTSEAEHAEHEQRDRRILAITWRGAWRKGLDSYSAQRRASTTR